MRKTVGLIAVIFLLMLCGMAAAEVAAQDNQYWEEGRIPVIGNAGGRISAKSDIFTGFSLMNAGSEGETLPAPANVHWKEGSTATAAWDAVEGAEYYKVKVYVYYDGEEIGNTEIGNTETGTADTEIDVQQEIYVILGENEPEAVQVAYSAAAGKYEAENEIVYGPESVVSDKIRYESFGDSLKRIA